MEITTSKTRAMGSSIRVMSRWRAPTKTIQEVFRLFKDNTSRPKSLVSWVIYPSENENEFIGQAIMMSKSGEPTGHFSVSVTMGHHLVVNKLSVRVKGTRFVISFPSTISASKMEQFVYNVLNALEKHWDFTK